ncbi:protein O-GlcNAcase-like isoform X2 [Amphiura filiformis]|uniref:protein O-GlcNAcase-like isoform X2 n=1 Tax=Amphiura filiformis TaxID=82378 RepID=UPI003B219D82
MISSSFMCGVVEGFYGRPWTPDQRVELFDLISSLGLNAYIYAPKDDLKHRAYWRELYSVEEAEHLTTLIQSAKENNVMFVYALSPGLDITFSNSKEVTCLKRKLEQVKQFGVDAFALLFDDIDTDMCVADKEVFQSFAHAQVSITNEVFQHLGQPKFLFCPTEYCATRAVPNVKSSEYLTTIGKKLLPDIDFMWTGPKVVSKVISLESIKELSDVIKRKPVIWDNIHANDYDQKRIFLGPYKGRSTTLFPYLNGIFTNPNCEFEVNFIAFHTLAGWAKASDTPADPKKGMQSSSLPCSPAISADIKLEQEGDIDSSQRLTDHGNYDPNKALVQAISDWMEEVMDSKTASSKFRRRKTGVPANILGTNPPPLPGINTCMATTTPTMSEGDTAPLPTLPLAEEIGKNKEAFDNLVDLVGANSSADPETFRPPPAINAVNSLLAKAEDILEPMECNGNIQSVAPVVPTKSCSMVQSCTSTTTTDSKIGEMAMQIDDSLGKDSQSPKTESELSPASAADSSSESAQDTEMQIDTTADAESDKAETSDIVSSETSTCSKDADKVQDEDNPAFTTALKTNEMLTKEDVMLLVELFYLPYEHGPRAVAMLEEVHWLKINAYIVCEAKQTGNPSHKAMEWRERAAKFVSYAKQVHGMMTRLLNIPNRSMLYYLYPYIWDMEGVLSLLASFIKWLGSSNNHKEAFMSGDLEPWVFRGGLTGEFQRVLPLESASDLFCKQPHRILSVVYTIRPYLPKDEESVYKVCLKTCDDGSDGTDTFPDNPDLIGDKLVGHFLTLSPEYCFVLEEGDQIVGYVLATLDAKAYFKKMEVAWITEMKRKYPKPSKTRSNLTPAEEIIQGFHSFNPALPDTLFEKFPSLLRMDVLADVEDKGVAKNMLACVLSALKSNGSKGAFVEVCTGDKNHLEAYTKLGFFAVPELQITQEDVNIVARAI